MWNNSANKFFDSLAAGRPIVINYQGWQADLIQAHGIGLIIPAQDSQLAAQQLVAYLGDTRTLEQARIKARQLAYEQFHRDKMAQKLVQVLEQAVTKR